MPRVIEVIESTITRGTGATDDPVRAVMRYHTLDGELLAEYDHGRCTYSAKHCAGVAERLEREEIAASS